MPQSNAPRIKGDRARLTIGGVTVLEAYDITVRVNVEMLESAAYGDMWKVKQPGVGEWQVTARRYMRVGNIGMFLGTTVQEPENLNQSGLRIVVYAGVGTSEQRVFEGDCFASSAVFNAPYGEVINEEITFEGNGEPIFPTGLL